MYNTGQYGGTADADIDAPEAWDIWQGISSVLIAIVDGGVYPNHSDLSGRVSGNTGSSPHATHVAGIAAAKGNNSFGVAGVDWNCSINSQIIGDIPQQAAAVRAAVNAGARIINDNWGQGSNDFSVTLRCLCIRIQIQRGIMRSDARRGIT
jgi:subtilisin family serine protease